jgi:hypothetical protein
MFYTYELVDEQFNAKHSSGCFLGQNDRRRHCCMHVFYFQLNLSPNIHKQIIFAFLIGVIREGSKECLSLTQVCPSVCHFVYMIKACGGFS